MPGLYFHIPFCKQACHYCNFHFSTALAQKDVMVRALVSELRLRAGYLQEKSISSIYFGGGTPSLLEIADIMAVFYEIQRHFHIEPDAEITLEANPDDLDLDKLIALHAETPINRLSIGVQSFHDEDLRWMNRAHGADQAHKCIRAAQKVGFDNLSVDLIYGSPSTSNEIWVDNLRVLLDYDVPHLSSYCLTVEEGTALGNFVKKGKQAPVDEIKAEWQFQYLIDTLVAAGIEQYEISNFAKKGFEARHNSSYWTGEPYLGIGPSAHSFDGYSRQWNIANNALYIQTIQAGKPLFERELLSNAQRYNEYIMTGLRTAWGVEKQKIARFGSFFSTYFEHEAARLLSSGHLVAENERFYIPKTHKFLSDGIASDLFYVE
jgi:oxygen-independent coproporphyrinogen III oxidase